MMENRFSTMTRSEASVLSTNKVIRNTYMLLSLTLVTFISFLFIGASVLTQAQITKAKGDWYSKVEVVVWMCPDGTSQSVNCTAGTAAMA